MTIKRVAFLQELLAFMGLEGRVHLAWISSAEAQKFVQVVTGFTAAIRQLGPNPLPRYRSAAKAGGQRPLRPCLEETLPQIAAVETILHTTP